MAPSMGIGIGFSGSQMVRAIRQDNPYYRQVQLLMRVLPYVAKENVFALKGGTAINLFVRDMPRLSVDIDLTYLPLDDREQALENIKAAFLRIKKDIESSLADLRVHYQADDNNESRMIVSSPLAQIKIELSPVLRGAVFPVENLSVRPGVEKEFGFAETQILPFTDLYAGKICAALDRQHPRDLFDVGVLFDNEGISRDLIRTFIVYLISHSRPISELIAPELRNLREKYEQEFTQMTVDPVPLEKLEQVRESLIKVVQTSLTQEDKEFLLSFKARKPKWDLLGLEGVDQLPAIRWKMINLERMSEEKHQQSLNQLSKILDSF